MVYRRPRDKAARSRWNLGLVSDLLPSVLAKAVHGWMGQHGHAQSREETAQALEVSERTVKREWAVARAWLQEALKESVS